MGRVVEDAAGNLRESGPTCRRATGPNCKARKQASLGRKAMQFSFFGRRCGVAESHVQLAAQLTAPLPSITPGPLAMCNCKRGHVGLRALLWRGEYGTQPVGGEKGALSTTQMQHSPRGATVSSAWPDSDNKFIPRKLAAQTPSNAKKCCGHGLGEKRRGGAPGQAGSGQADGRPPVCARTLAWGLHCMSAYAGHPMLMSSCVAANA